MAFKDRFFRISSPVASALPVPLLRKLAGIRMILPMYHAVSDTPAPHLKYLYHVRSQKQFRADIDTLLRHFEPLGLEEVLKQSADPGSYPKPAFHLSFDDGLREFYEVAAPILKEKGVPATCFLNNDFLDNRDMMYRLKTSLLIDHMHGQGTGSESWKIFHQWAEEHGLGHAYYRKILLDIGYSRSDLLEDLAQRLGISFTEYSDTMKPYMSVSEVKELIRQGFTFGAHTARHPDFMRLSADEQVSETLESVQDITSTFGLEYRVFSFPFTDFGVTDRFFSNEQLRTGVDRTFGCAGIKKDSAPDHMQRIAVELYGGSLESLLGKEYLYSSLLRISGKQFVKH